MTMPNTDEADGNLLSGLLKAKILDLLKALALLVVSSALTFTGAIFVQQLVDNVLPTGSYTLLSALAATMLIASLLRIFCTYAQYIILTRLAQRIDYALVIGLYKHIVKLPQGFFNVNRPGEISAKIRETGKVRNFLSSTLVNVAHSILTLLFCLSLMMLYSTQLALLSISLLPVIGFCYYLADSRSKIFQRQLAEQGAEVEAHWIETLQTLPVIRSFGLHESMAERAEQKFLRSLRTSWSAGLTSTIVSNCVTLIIVSYSVAILWYGGALVIGGELTTGELMSLFTMATTLAPPIGTLINSNSALREAWVGGRRLQGLFASPKEINRGSRVLAGRNLDVTFEGVTFGYQSGVPILRNVNFTLFAGKVNLIMGHSGCGKSTISHLVNRLYQDYDGAIRIGGREIRDYTLHSLRGSIGNLHQMPVFFTGSILDNVTLDLKDADRVERFNGISKRIGANDFIDRLHLKELTVLRENAASLSGGQRQRLAVMRALYGNSPIIILDEPTNNLDAASEDLLMSYLKELSAQGSTVIVISHSQNAKKWADLVYLVDMNGCVSLVT